MLVDLQIVIRVTYCIVNEINLAFGLNDLIKLIAELEKYIYIYIRVSADDKALVTE